MMEKLTMNIPFLKKLEEKNKGFHLHLCSFFEYKC